MDLLTAFAAGLLSFASPCVLPLLPVYLASLAGSSVADVRAGGQRRALMISATAFVLGLSATFAGLGVVAASVGGAIRSAWWLGVAGGAIALVFGVEKLGLVKLPFGQNESRPLLGKLKSVSGPFGAFFFGAAFGLGWTPCVGPMLGGVLTRAAMTGDRAISAVMLLAYAAGLGLPLLAAAFAAPQLLRLFDRFKARLGLMEKAAGALLVVGGLVLVAQSWPATAAEPVAAAACDTPGAPGTESCGVTSSPAEADLAMTPVLPAPMVELVSTDCAVCKKMKPVVEKVVERCGEGAIVTIDVASEVGRRLASALAVRSVPTFVDATLGGDPRVRFVGAQSQADLEAALREAGACSTPVPTDG